jgi:anti-anti-sigma factor
MHRVGQASTRTTPVSVPTPTRLPEARLNVAVTKLIDDIDLENATRLYREILDGIIDDAIGLVVDLSEVRHIDSAGIRMLHKLAGWLAQRRMKLRLVVPDTSSLRRVLELSRFDAYVSVTSTVDSAVSEIQGNDNRIRASEPAAD